MTGLCSQHCLKSPRDLPGSSVLMAAGKTACGMHSLQYVPQWGSRDWGQARGSEAQRGGRLEEILPIFLPFARHLSPSVTFEGEEDLTGGMDGPVEKSNTSYKYRLGFDELPANCLWIRT